MQKFLINAIKDYAGRKYWVVNFPGNRLPRSRKPARRVQKKFNSLEKAEEFLKEIKREWTKTGKIRLGLDPDLHCDVLRAVELLSEVPNGTLERAAYVFLQCVSGHEKRGMGYEVAINRRVELSPRFFLMVQNEAQCRKVSISEATEGLLSEVALCRAEQAIGRQKQSEETEYHALKKRNKIDCARLRELAREAKIRQEFSGIRMMFEEGRQSVLAQKAEYQRRWRQRKKEREAREKERQVTINGEGRGNGDMQ
jgi:hypothetical protein